MIGNDWDIVLKEILDSKEFIKFYNKIINLYNEKTIFPPKNQIFSSLILTPYKDVKVVIVGQDPYHGYNEAHGLSFSVIDGVKLPPSLKNIYKELYNDLNIVKSTGDLTSWAKEGVLLLNSVLTVEKNTPGSHRNMGWEKLTDYIIGMINLKDDPVVFILWGNYAKEKKKLITNKKHLVLESVHPSPFSARNGFFGSKPFSKTNIFLEENNIKTINW